MSIEEITSLSLKDVVSFRWELIYAQVMCFIQLLDVKVLDPDYCNYAIVSIRCYIS